MGREPQTDNQLTEAGELRHLLTLEGLDRSLIWDLLDLSQEYRRPIGQVPARDHQLAGHTVANLFFDENPVLFQSCSRRSIARYPRLAKGNTALTLCLVIQPSIC